MVLKDRLNWLHGFPVVQQGGVVTWLTLAHGVQQPPTRIALDGAALHRATRAWTKLVYHFPNALPQVVDDYNQWVAGVPTLLDWLKPAIHEQQPLPASLFNIAGAYPSATVARVARLIDRYPRLQTVLDALSWSSYLTPAEVAPALGWLEENHAAITVILTQSTPAVDDPIEPDPIPADPRLTVLLLWQLTHSEDVQQTVPLLAALGNEHLYTTPMAQVTPYIEAWIAATEAVRVFLGQAGTLPSPPPITAAADLHTFLLALSQARHPVRRRLLTLLAILLADAPIDGWLAWWAMAEPLIARTRRLIAAAQAQRYWTFHEPYIAQLDALRDELQALLPLQPMPLAWWQQLPLLQTLAADGHQPFLTAALPILDRLPVRVAGLAVRHRLLIQWSSLYRTTPAATLAYLRLLRDYLAQPLPLDHLLQPWLAEWRRLQKAWRQYDFSDYGGFFDRSVVVDVPDRTQWPHLFATLTAACKRFPGRMTANRAEWLIALAQAFADPDDVLVHFAALGRTELVSYSVNEELLGCLLTCDRPAAEWDVLAPALVAVQERDWALFERIVLVAAWLRSTPWAAVTAALIAQGEAATIGKIGEQLAWLQAMNFAIPPLPMPTVQALPAWTARYPAALQPALRILLAVDPTAERTAARVLGKAWPNPDKLRMEIVALEVQIPTHPEPALLEQRLANLRQRLATPVDVTPARQAMLATKLTLAAYRILLAQWQRASDSLLTTHLRAWLVVDSLPAWVRDPEHLTVITALLTLPEPTRSLALRLLRQRAGAPPWCLHDEPANQAYLQRLHTLGIDATLWITPAPPQLYTGDNGRQVWVGLEEDPLEIFHMGGYFHTCLRPGSFNFFSVVANAADVNKQVVYARDAEGNVVGRCLLALTDHGQLLTFEPYCHDPALNFREMMARFATSLAAGMGTTVAYHGRVATLVATDWYDDGPRDLSDAFAFLEPGSAFMRELETVAPTALIALLTAAFDPLPLNALTLPMVLYLPPVTARPQLVLPLLALIGDGKGYPDHLLMHVAELARRAGDMDFVHKIVRTRIIPRVLADCTRRRRGRADVVRDLDLIIAVDPSAALRILRQTRSRRVRRDEDETDRTRLRYLAQVHEALGSAGRAARLRARIA
jgi:hypothetical protein